MEVIVGELRKLREGGVGAEELARAKENVKGRTVLSMESMLARMNRLGSSVLTGIPLLSLDEILARTDAVTADDLAALVSELYDPARLSAAAVGGDKEVFKRTLEAVNPELVAA